MLRIFVTRQSRYPANTKTLKTKVLGVLKEHGVQDAEVSIALVGERKMRELAKRHLGEKGQLHEVLSFPFIGDDVKTGFPQHPRGLLQLGEVVVCYPYARKIAIRRSRMMDDVIGELVEHGILHLLGKHHG